MILMPFWLDPHFLYKRTSPRLSAELPPPDPAKDFFKISGEKLRVRDGGYAMQITEELWETSFLDQVRLLAIDHPAGTEVFVNEAFVLPPFPHFASTASPPSNPL